MDLFSIGLLVAGILLLVTGRRLFWLCAALVGFAIGINFGIGLFNSPLLAWGMAILFALIGAWLAIRFVKIAVWIVGFFLGVAITGGLFNMFGWAHSLWYWLALIVVGLICAVVLGLFFNWGLIVLSSFVGAIFVSDAIDGWLGIAASWSTLILLGLLVVGIVVQGVQLRTAKGKTT